jgi:hypothetical protein
MKSIKSPFFRRSVATLLLLVFLQSVFLPEYAWALTVGPNQPEYTSYEEPGSTDMVNLLTGDFGFSLPIVEVGSPEGSFSVPLSYSAGIGPSQEASWVGLGWSLNPGCITRTFNGFPDDSNGDSQTVTVQDPGVRSWNARFFGIGQFGWSNLQGHYGRLSLLSIVNASWTEDFSSVGIAGFNVTSDGGVQVNPIETTLAVVSILSLGASSAGWAASEIPKNAAIGLIAGAATDAAFSLAQGSRSSVGGGYWEYSRSVKRLPLPLIGRYKEERIWLDRTKVENMYGLLYLGNAPLLNYSAPGYNALLSLSNNGTLETLRQFEVSTHTANRGAASDIVHMADANEDLKQFEDINNPVFLAPDNFAVKSPGISGSITPYRLESGSVSMPREMTANHRRLAPVPFLANNNSYKVPFLYEDIPSNSYFHTMGGSASPSSPAFHYGIDASNSSIGTIWITVSDLTMQNQRIGPNYQTAKKIPQQNAIEWFSSSELLGQTVQPFGYMDFLHGGTGSTVAAGSPRHAFRSSISVGSRSAFYSTTSFSQTITLSASDFASVQPQVNDQIDLRLSISTSTSNQNLGITNSTAFISNVTIQSVNSSANSIQVSDSRLNPFLSTIANVEVKFNKTPQRPNTIGAFCITAANGTTYHYGLPVYEYDFYTEVRNKTNTANRSIIDRKAPFANTWLLTAVTGPDFVDRNSNGMVDTGDWGKWFKLNYGIHSNAYTWRTPFSEYSNLPNDQQEAFSTGKNQLIYLNSIESRSQVALFFKGNRTDGGSAPPVVNPLRLEELILVNRATYEKTIASAMQGGFGQTNLTDQVNAVLLTNIYSPTAFDFVTRNALKRVKFNYDYSLATGAPNASGSGKLSLNSISFLGRSGVSVLPSYKFKYASGPSSYQEHHYDVWGMYNPDATTNFGSHQVSPNDQDAIAWSLTEIQSPLGGTININYERDSYSSVSGYPTEVIASTFDNPNQIIYMGSADVRRLKVASVSQFAVGDQIKIFGETVFSCPATNGTTRIKTLDGQNFITVNAVGSNYIEFNAATDPDINGYAAICGTSSGTQINVQSQYGTIYKKVNSRKGGNLRVSAITSTNDYGVTNKVQYLYTVGGIPGGLSSGVVAQEPSGLNGNNLLKFDDKPEYPTTPVMYGEVTVLNGRLTNLNDYYTKDVFSFQTPHYSQYDASVNLITNKQLTTEVDGYKDYVTKQDNRIQDRTSKIGRLLSQAQFQQNGAQVRSSQFEYTETALNAGVNNYQGVFAESVLMVDRIHKVEGNGDLSKSVYHKLNRTTTVKYPSILKKVTNSKDGYTTVSENTSWDFLTGGVLEKITKSNLGVYVKSVMVPAYTKYPELGSKALNPANKNMLAQNAAEYSFKSNSSGANLGLLNASATVWRKDWPNYRVFSGSNQRFEDGNEGHPIWRISDSYTYLGDFASRQADGSLLYSSANDFNFVNPGASTRWQKTQSIERYDRYSMPLDVSDPISSIRGTKKLGYQDQYIIAEASNAAYTEIAFSSAEDLRGDIPFFGGEVALGSGSVLRKSRGQTSDVHTGDAVLSLGTGTAFIYKTNQLTLNRTYRLNVWTNSLNGRLYYRINNGTEVVSGAPDAASKAGNWYLLTMQIPVGATLSMLEVGVRSAAGTSLFDDFRFQPADAAMVCYVYDPLDMEYTAPFKQFSYTLDNDHLYVKVEYDPQGFSSKTYRESFKYGEKLMSETRQNYKRFNTNQ